MTRRELLPLLATSLMGQKGPAAGDWPQWRGPHRNAISDETGLLKSWPRSGPPMVWTASGLGEGYGSLCIVGDCIFLQGAAGGKSMIHALDRKEGKRVWSTPLGSSESNDRGGGPRGTPTFGGGRLHVLTEAGDLACLDASSGKILWQRNVLRDFKANNPHWLVSESPLIDGDHVIVTPGGREGGIVALSMSDGKTVWAARELTDPAGYASCIAADVSGVRTIMNLTARAGVGVRASDGKLLWRYEAPANRTANCATPVFHDNKVFYTSAYGTGCGLLEIEPAALPVRTREVYFNREMQNHHGGVVLIGGHIYGFSGSILTCIEFATGKSLWKERSVGKGCVSFADGLLYLLGEGNVMGLAEAGPRGYSEKGRFNIEDQGRPSWAHPVVAGGRLHIRNQGKLWCYNVKA